MQDSIVLGKKWPNKIGPSGIALDEAANKLYVVSRDSKSLYLVDLATKTHQQFELGGEAYACVLSPDKKELYIS